MIPRQHIIEDGTVRTLEEFADCAVKHLEGHPEFDEVVQLAHHITELQNDHMTPPALIYRLPEGYRYNWSGFSGQVLGIMRLEL